MERVLILRRSQPFSARAVDFAKLLEPSLENKIQAGLAKRLPSRSVVVGQLWAEPQDFEILVAIVERAEKPWNALEPGSSRKKVPLTFEPPLPRSLPKAALPDKFDGAIRLARNENKTIIWACVEGTPALVQDVGSLRAFREPKVAIYEKTLEEDLDKLAHAIETHGAGFLADAVEAYLPSPTEEPKKSATLQSSPQFDVFLCHNSGDKPLIRDIAKRLSGRGIRYWLDEEQSRPGTEWQDLLESQIESIQAAAVFVGPSGVGPWHNREMKAFINEFVERQCKVIPVILQGVQTVPKLPLFFKGLTWVDFRNKEPDPLKQLVWGITGVRS